LDVEDDNGGGGGGFVKEIQIDIDINLFEVTDVGCSESDAAKFGIKFSHVENILEYIERLFCHKQMKLPPNMST
jgi:hypothetical protein